MVETTAGLGHLTSAVRDRVEELIREEYAAGEQLPTERELGERFGVSRVTVRRALAALTHTGAVFAIQGRGTFVASDRLAEPPDRLLSFHELVASEHVQIAARPLRVETRPATLDEAEHFRIAPGALLFELSRLRTLDGLPVAIDETTLPLALDPGLADADWSHESLYARLLGAGHAPASADYVVEAAAADPAVADLLTVAPGSPVLVTRSEVSDGAGRLVVVGAITYRGDRYRFRSRLTAGQEVASVSGGRVGR